MDKFTVEEMNLMCVFEGQDRTGMIADIKSVMPHIQDSDMVELSKQILEKLEAMSNEAFAEVAPEAASDSEYNFHWQKRKNKGKRSKTSSQSYRFILLFN